MITRITEHGTKESGPMFKRLSLCKIFKDCCWLYSLSLLFSENEHDDVSMTSDIFYSVLQNHELFDSNCNWFQLVFLEVYYIKNHDPIINHGLTASKKKNII